MRRLYLLFLLLAAGPALADFNEGVAYYARGDYEKAAQIMLPLAESADHPYAEHWLARMYALGQGVEQNLETAAKWYRRASEQGIAASQYQLGLMYRDGKGVPEDMESAYAWFKVASKQGHQKATDALAGAESKLSPEELSEATKLAEEFIRKYSQPPKTTPEGTEAPLRQP